GQGSGGPVDGQFEVDAAIPFLADGFELAAVFDRALVDVHRHRHPVGTDIGDGVVLVRGNQAAGTAGAGLHATGGAEAAAVAIGVEQFVLGDLEFAVPHALDAPQAAVVVYRGALAGAPGHGDDAVAVFGAAVELAPGVV